MKNLFRKNKYRVGGRVVVVGNESGLFPDTIYIGDAGVITRKQKLFDLIPVLVIDFDNGETDMAVPEEFADKFIRKE